MYKSNTLLSSVSGVTKPHDEVVKGVIRAVREHVGPVAAFKSAVIVHKLPKTRSGKIARNTISAMLAGKEYKVRKMLYFCALGFMMI